jgi:uncharacterized damage-inducible protein DinB
MKLRIAIGSALLTIILAAAAFAANPDEKPTFASVLDHQLAGTEKTVVPAADAMPEDKYSFVPTGDDFKDVRTFGLEVKHMATANYALGAAILGEKPPMNLEGPNGPASVKSKAEIMKYLNDSFAYAHKALNSITDANVLEPIKSPFGNNMTTRLALATSIIGHPFDHYGQMVVYLRMNNIIPPASRK